MTTTIGAFTVEAIDINATDCPIAVTKGAARKVYLVESDAWNLINHIVDHSDPDSDRDMVYSNPEAAIEAIFNAYPSEEIIREKQDQYYE